MAEAEYGKMIVWGGVSIFICAFLHAVYRIFFDNSHSKSAPVTSDPPCKPIAEKEAIASSDSAQPKAGKTKKRPVWKNKSEFAHPWLLKSLKGHPGTVLDMEFSSNGKYLVSTCEEAVRTPSPSPPRRRKPRGRLRPPPPSPPEAPPAPILPPRMSADELYASLWPHVLSSRKLWILGYPVELAPNTCKAGFYVSMPRRLPRPPPVFYDVNAPEFVPGGGSGSISSSSSASDSGHGSGGSSPQAYSDDEAVGGVDHTCVRCSAPFRIGADGDYITKERCYYHWGRSAGGRLACCGGSPGSPGCTIARLHVWNGTQPGHNGPLDGFVRARTRRGGVFSLDTEMCYTTAGLELASVAVVGADGRLVYKATVRPRAPVIDYNTRFSGIRQRDLERATKTLRDVQNDILGFVGTDTLLVGHALENDLRALKLLHGAVVDTCALYPHELGFPMRRSLRALAADHLGRSVQAGPHSPLEDARTALDLALLLAHRERAAAC